MTTVRNVFDHLNKLADIKLAEKWDNVGLMLGDYNSEARKVLVCLDVTTKVVNEAIANNVNLIVSHHPLIFKPLKSLDFTDDFKSNILRDLILNDISVISFHTNLDSATYGLNDFLAKKIGELSEEFTQEKFIAYIKEKFNLKTVSAVLGNNNKIKTVALLGGSGADFIYTLPEVDAYLTGDIGYHAALDAMEMKKNIIDVGHFTEHLVKDLLLEYVGQLPIDVEKSKVEESPFKIL